MANRIRPAAPTAAQERERALQAEKYWRAWQARAERLEDAITTALSNRLTGCPGDDVLRAALSEGRGDGEG